MVVVGDVMLSIVQSFVLTPAEEQRLAYVMDFD
jgi:hypothetical protein